MIIEGDFVASTGSIRAETNMAFCREVDLSGAGEVGVVSFNATVASLVIQDVQAACYHGDVELQVISGFTDANLTAEKLPWNIWDDTARFCRKYSVGEKSSLVVQISASQKIVPVVLRYGNGEPAVKGDTRTVFGRTLYRPVPKDWAIVAPQGGLITDGAAATRTGGALYRFEIDERGRPCVAERHRSVIWQSDWPKSVCESALSAYVDRYVANLSVENTLQMVVENDRGQIS